MQKFAMNRAAGQRLFNHKARGGDSTRSRAAAAVVCRYGGGTV